MGRIRGGVSMFRWFGGIRCIMDGIVGVDWMWSICF